MHKLTLCLFHFPLYAIASHWLEFLIHIIATGRDFAHFKLFVDERKRVDRRRANFSPEGRCRMLRGRTLYLKRLNSLVKGKPCC